MNQFFQFGKDLAFTRDVGVAFFKPPVELWRDHRWHTINTHLGRMQLEWRAGIGVWRDRDGQQWAAECGAQNKWSYVGLADPPPPQVNPDDSGALER